MIHKSEMDPEFISNGDDSLDYEISEELPYIDDGETPYLEIDWRQFGVDPTKPTKARPGSAEKVRILAARYAAGLPLWHEEDSYDHSPQPAEEPVSSEDMFEFSDLVEDDLDDEEGCELIDELG